MSRIEDILELEQQEIWWCEGCEALRKLERMKVKIVGGVEEGEERLVVKGNCVKCGKEFETISIASARIDSARERSGEGGNVMIIVINGEEPDVQMPVCKGCEGRHGELDSCPYRIARALVLNDTTECYDADIKVILGMARTNPLVLKLAHEYYEDAKKDKDKKG